jgi:hypothetical protein
MNRFPLLLLLGTLLTGLANFRPGPNVSVRHQTADTLRVDTETGLVDTPNLVMVKTHCTGCHSTKLILQHRFTRDGWQERIRWMQKNHKLWDLGEAEKPVLDYLEAHYGPDKQATTRPFRRKPVGAVEWYKL